MQYTTENKNGRHFSLSDERQQPIGQLDRISWWSGNAQITLHNGAIYDVKAAGWPRANISISKNGAPYADLKYNWRIAIDFIFASGRKLSFKRRRVFRSDYIVIDEAQNEIASIKPRFSWNIFAMRYEINVSDGVAHEDFFLTLPFILIYCMQYIQARTAIH